MTLRSWLIFGTLGLVGAGLLYAREQERDQELAGLRRDLEALAAARDTPRFERLLNPPGAADGAVRLVPGLPATPPPVDEPAPELTYEEMGARMDVIFQQQASDAGWAAGARRLAEERLRAALPDGSSVQRVDCRQSMCRIEARHRDAETYARFTQRVLSDEATQVWNGGFMNTVIAEHADASLVTVTYLAREGQGLPEI